MSCLQPRVSSQAEPPGSHLVLLNTSRGHAEGIYQATGFARLCRMLEGVFNDRRHSVLCATGTIIINLGAAGLRSA